MELSSLVQFIVLFGVSSNTAPVTSALQCYECTYKTDNPTPKSLCMEVPTTKTLVDCNSEHACFEKTFTKKVQQQNLTMANWGCFNGSVSQCTSTLSKQCAVKTTDIPGCTSRCWKPSTIVTVPTTTPKPTTTPEPTDGTNNGTATSEPNSMAPTNGSGIHCLTTTIFVLIFFLVKEMVVY